MIHRINFLSSSLTENQFREQHAEVKSWRIVDLPARDADTVHLTLQANNITEAQIAYVVGLRCYIPLSIRSTRTI